MPQGKGTYGDQVGRPPKKSSGFKMKGFSAFTKHVPGHEETSPQYSLGFTHAPREGKKMNPTITRTRGLVRKENESLGELLKRAQKAGLTKFAEKIKAQMDKGYDKYSQLNPTNPEKD